MKTRASSQLVGSRLLSSLPLFPPSIRRRPSPPLVEDDRAWWPEAEAEEEANRRLVLKQSRGAAAEVERLAAEDAQCPGAGGASQKGLR